MAMPWHMTLWMAKMVWIALSGWVSSCIIVADEVAGSLRTGDIGPFHVGGLRPNLAQNRSQAEFSTSFTYPKSRVCDSDLRGYIWCCVFLVRSYLGLYNSIRSFDLGVSKYGSNDEWHCLGQQVTSSTVPMNSLIKGRSNMKRNSGKLSSGEFGFET